MMDNTRAWVEINLDNIAYNTRQIRKATNASSIVMGVVKADAYGHGAVEVAECVLRCGVSRLAVSQADEALQLRMGGIDAPILVLSDLEEERAEELITNDISQVVFSVPFARTLSDAACKLGRKAKIHVKIDTGMGRVGFRAEQLECGDESIYDEIMEIAAMDGIEIEGIFTHFAVSDVGEDADRYTHRQYELFTRVCDELERRGVCVGLRHAANSAAIFRFPEMHLDMVRAGLILYGLYPSDEVRAVGVDLRPAMTFKARVTSVKKVPSGSFLSYGCTYQTERESVIATVPVGYADGYARSLGNRSRVLIGGEYAPVCGRVCMDQCLVDVTEHSDVSVGDEVVLFGKQGAGEVTLEELAAIEGTINYEIICVVGKRIPRKYIEDGKIVKVVNGLIR